MNKNKLKSRFPIMNGIGSTCADNIQDITTPNNKKTYGFREGELNGNSTVNLFTLEHLTPTQVTSWGFNNEEGDILEKSYLPVSIKSVIRAIDSVRGVINDGFSNTFLKSRDISSWGAGISFSSGNAFNDIRTKSFDDDDLQDDDPNVTWRREREEKFVQLYTFANLIKEICIFYKDIANVGELYALKAEDILQQVIGDTKTIKINIDYNTKND